MRSDPAREKGIISKGTAVRHFLTVNNYALYHGSGFSGRDGNPAVFDF